MYSRSLMYPFGRIFNFGNNLFSKMAANMVAKSYKQPYLSSQTCSVLDLSGVGGSADPPPPPSGFTTNSANMIERQIQCRLLCIHGPGIHWSHFQDFIKGGIIFSTNAFLKGATHVFLFYPMTITLFCQRAMAQFPLNTPLIGINYVRLPERML